MAVDSQRRQCEQAGHRAKRRKRGRIYANQRHPERPAPPPPQRQTAQGPQRDVGSHLPRGHPIGGIVHRTLRMKAPRPTAMTNAPASYGPVTRNPGPHVVGVRRSPGPSIAVSGLGPPSAQPGHDPSVGLCGRRCNIDESRHCNQRKARCRQRPGVPSDIGSWPSARCAAHQAVQAGHMITTTALTKSYNKVPVVSDVSLRCEPGTITGFLGVERRREVHHTEDDRRAGATRSRHGDHRRPTVRRATQPDARGRDPARRGPRCIPDAVAGPPSRSPRGWQEFTRGGSSTCWTSSGSPTPRRNESGPTHLACASASASPKPSSANRLR